MPQSAACLSVVCTHLASLILGLSLLLNTSCLIPPPTVCRMQAIQNLGLAVVPLVAGYIVDHNGYLMLEVFFCAMLCIALIAGTCAHAMCCCCCVSACGSPPSLPPLRDTALHSGLLCGRGSQQVSMGQET